MWNIHWWMSVKSPIYINSLDIRKCYKEWRECSKFFIRPHWRYVYRFKGAFNIFRLEINPLEWKSKYGEPRHEEDPEIKLSLLWWTWVWRLGQSEGKNIDSMIFWEAVLWVQEYEWRYKHKNIPLNYAKIIYNTIKVNTWSNQNGVKDTPMPFLTEYAKHLYDTWSHHLDVKASRVSSDSEPSVVDKDSED